MDTESAGLDEGNEGRQKKASITVRTIGGILLLGVVDLVKDGISLGFEYTVLAEGAPLQGKTAIQLAHIFAPTIVAVVILVVIVLALTVWRTAIWVRFPKFVANGRWTSAERREQYRQEGRDEVEDRIRAQQAAAYSPAWRFRMQKWGHDLEHEDHLVLHNDGRGTTTEVIVDSLEPDKITVCNRVPRLKPDAGPDPDKERWEKGAMGAVPVHVSPTGKRDGAALTVSYINEAGVRVEPYTVFVHPDHLVPRKYSQGRE
ncbi:hypothetical protein [Arthrobacter sp. SX1312]|uniref:hypothetical protein n=1 Tax=Arthrobacter sp. SX1312 TaxID=2058896 RepID=UPI0011AFEB08|nr:hypothetical protein [Arthrobacter sp. SX1312]